jgi:hypothetical protein
MATTSTSAGKADRVRTGDPEAEGGRALRASLAAWLFPGAGHLLLGDPRRAAIYCVTLMVMFITGLAFGGRLFPIGTSEPLVMLAALAQWGVFGPRLVAGGSHLGTGDVVAATYEYGNTFLIVAGLLNLLVALDAWDRAMGRRAG